MSLKSDLETEVANIFKEQFVTRNGQVVPSDSDLKLGNDAVLLDATVLYADISDSTRLVDGYKAHFAAEVYKAFLRCATKVIINGGGTITAYDGDRVMAVFLGDNKNTSAVKCGLKVNWVAKNIVQPAIKNQYPSNNFVLKHVVGIDTSPIFVARAGIRGSNDLVWIGRSANYAAKLCTLSDDYSTWITKDVYDRIEKDAKFSSDKNMWEERSWTAMNGMTIFRSSYWWSFT